MLQILGFLLIYIEYVKGADILSFFFKNNKKHTTNRFLFSVFFINQSQHIFFIRDFILEFFIFFYIPPTSCLNSNFFVLGNINSSSHDRKSLSKTHSSYTLENSKLSFSDEKYFKLPTNYSYIRLYMICGQTGVIFYNVTHFSFDIIIFLKICE